MTEDISAISTCAERTCSGSTTTLFYGDYKAAFSDAVTDLIAEDITDRDERIAAVNGLLEAYVDSVGETPDSAECERLADYILREELNDSNPHKVAHTEYPFFSEYQLERRHNREVSLWVADALGTDGEDHRPKKRRMRSKWENEYIDRHVKIRNKERARQYRIDTSPGPIIPYTTESFVSCRGIGERWRSLVGIAP